MVQVCSRAARWEQMFLEALIKSSVLMVKPVRSVWVYMIHVWIYSMCIRREFKPLLDTQDGYNVAIWWTTQSNKDNIHYPIGDISFHHNV